MPPLPKPPGQRVRRNKDQSTWKQLPEQGSNEPAPPLPTKKPAWLKSTRTKWERLWASPMATTYVDADLIALERMALLWDEIARGNSGGGRLNAVQNLEDRFGISPKGRRQLQWEIAKSEVVELPKKKPARRLRAVESA
jgi:hypothetical protein